MSSLFPPTAARDLQSRVPAAAHLRARGCQGAAAKQHVQCLAIAVTDTVPLPTAERGSICHQALFPGSFYRQVILAQTCTAPVSTAWHRSSFTKTPGTARLHLHPEHVRQQRGGKAQQGETQHCSEPGFLRAGLLCRNHSETSHELNSQGPTESNAAKESPQRVSLTRGCFCRQI